MTKRKKNQQKLTGKHPGETKTGMSPEQPSAALDAQPKTDRANGGFPVVGIGASAGGLAAFEAFFSGMPVDTDPGMAFVLVQHLAPDHKSILSDLIRRYTRMQVFEVEDGMEVQPNCAYIIPPGRDLGFADCNLAALDLLGMNRDQLLAADAVSLSPERQPDGRLSREKAGELIARCLAKGSLRFDWLHCRADGAPLPVEVTMTVYHEQGKTFVHSVWRDLTGLTRTTPPGEHSAARQQEEKP